MKKFFKFGKGRKESAEASSKTGSSVSRHGSVSSLMVSSGGYEVREKDMSKLHRAAWMGDMSKLTQLIKSSRGNLADKENRLVIFVVSMKRKEFRIGPPNIFISAIWERQKKMMEAKQKPNFDVEMQYS